MKNKLICRLAVAVLILAMALSLAACGEEEKDSIYSLTYKTQKLTLGGSADGVLEALGTYKSRTSIGNCGGLGEQIKYVYDDITLYILEGKDGHTVDAFSLNNDLIATNEGISIGDPESKVTETYGTPTARTAQKLEYQDGNQYLVFDLDENGAVIGIEWKIVNA